MPQFGGDTAPPEQRLGNLAMGGAGHMTVDCT